VNVREWRLHRDGAASGPRNMALDHALAETLDDGVAVLRLYEWTEPTVSFGRNEPAVGRWGGGRGPTGAPEAHPFRFVRRPTGGRAVLHRGELTYAAVLPDRAFGGPRAAYAAVNEALVQGLRLLGVGVTLAGASPALRPDAGPCFDAPAAGEVVADGGKLVGSAQARLCGALLQHGAILIDDDQAALGQASAARPLRRLVESVTVADVRDAVEEGFRRRFAGIRWEEADAGRRVRLAAARLEAERYEDDTWTWRR
jgi:lipoyl(octanoyl) transferase